MAGKKDRRKVDEKQQINVRMPPELYERITQDADEGGRTVPGQVRLILKKYYEDEL